MSSSTDGLPLSRPPVRTVHLVYPHGDRISAPDSIGRHLGEHLASRYEVKLHDWDAGSVIRGDSQSVLVGHAHPDPCTVFRRSAREPGWRRVLAMSPYNGDLRQIAFLDDVIPRCDRFLAITGSYWYERLPQSRVAHWGPKTVHMDMAVDRHDFPPLGRTWNAIGKRRIVYIGHTAWMKNTGYLSEIAAQMPETSFAWIGSGEDISGVQRLGQLDFSLPDSRLALSAFDFVISVSTADANPTTILEAMAWGLIPVCTPESGYAGIRSIPNIPLAAPAKAAEFLRELLSLDADQLDGLQRANWQLLDSHFNWKRFSAQLVDEIESDVSPPLGPQSVRQRFSLRRIAWTSPYSPWRRRIAKVATAPARRWLLGPRS